MSLYKNDKKLTTVNIYIYIYMYIYSDDKRYDKCCGFRITRQV